MVYVVVFAVSVFLSGLLLLALLGLRAFRQVKALGRTVGEASEKIAEATTTLDAVALRKR